MKKYSKLIGAALIAAVFVGTFVFLYQKSQPKPVEYIEFTPEIKDILKTTIITGTRFKTLAYERAKQRNRLRRMHDSTAMQPTKEIIYDLTAQMAELRRQMKLCEDIAERCGVIEMVVNEIERGQIAEKKKPAEKKKCEKGIDIR